MKHAQLSKQLNFLNQAKQAGLIKKPTYTLSSIVNTVTPQPRQFMPAYDIDDSNGSARLNWKKAALLPNWRETFRKFDRNSRGKANTWL